MSGATLSWIKAMILGTDLRLISGKASVPSNASPNSRPTQKNEDNNCWPESNLGVGAKALSYFSSTYDHEGNKHGKSWCELNVGLNVIYVLPI